MGFTVSNIWYSHLSECDEWYTLPEPKMHQTIARFGHTAEVYEKDMYLFGGFEGVMLADLYKYSPGKFQTSKFFLIHIYLQMYIWWIKC